MFNPLTWLDGVLLDAAQKFCDKTQRVVGLTNFTFEKWAIILSVSFHWGAYFLKPIFVVVAPLLIFTIGGAFLIRGIERKEAEFLKNGNFTRPFLDTPARIVALIGVGLLAAINFVSADFGNNVLSYGQICYIAWAYFGSCIPRPPSKSKARELYEKVLWWLNDRLQPAPAPATNQ